MGDIKKISLFSPEPPPPSMPTAQELKRVQEVLDAQIAVAEQEECKAKEARLWAEEEARVAAEKARLEEEQCEQEEEEDLAVERDLHEVGGPSRERAPRRWLFLPSSDSAGSPEEEEGMPGPSCDKGKGRVPVLEEVRGEVTGVICNLCEKKGIPCWWGKVSSILFFWILLTSLYRRQPAFGPAWAANKPRQSVT